jgi:hypothetical protein
MKIICPYHDDKTPSMHCYEETAYCFVCSKTIPIEEVLDAEEIRKLKALPKEKEDVKETIEWIKTLPTRVIRGLELPYVRSDYFILWPDESYYKRRLGEGKSRYVGPRGHSPSLFRCRPEPAHIRDRTSVIVVEGELNAMSLDLARRSSGSNDDVWIVSPGSASSLQAHVDYYLTFKNIVVIVDKDQAGVENGLKLKEQFKKRKRYMKLIALDVDFNQTLQDGGVEGILKQLSELL